MIKQKTGKCIDCPEGAGEMPLIAKRCERHYWSFRRTLKEDKVGNKIGLKPVSDFALQRNLEYRKLRKAFMADHKYCEAKLSAGVKCQVLATEIHHMQGREGNLLIEVEKWKAICHNCHRWITEHSAEAITMGLSLRRNT